MGTVFTHGKPLVVHQHPSARNGDQSSEDGVWLPMWRVVTHVACGWLPMWRVVGYPCGGLLFSGNARSPLTLWNAFVNQCTGPGDPQCTGPGDPQCTEPGDPVFTEQCYHNCMGGTHRPVECIC